MTVVTQGIRAQARGVARDLHVNAFIVEHPDPEVAQLADAGEATADTNSSSGRFVDRPVGEVPGPDARQASIANRSGNPPIGPFALEELLPGHVHRRSLAPKLATDGRRWAPVNERPAHRIQEEPPFRPIRGTGDEVWPES
jgi:hypothetical protein